MEGFLWKFKGTCCSVQVGAEFSPCGPEPNRCYVTDTSHPDVALTGTFRAVQ